jgi:hypothetical protein
MSVKGRWNQKRIGEPEMLVKNEGLAGVRRICAGLETKAGSMGDQVVIACVEGTKDGRGEGSRTGCRGGTNGG